MSQPERWKQIAPATDEPGQRRAGADAKKRRQAIAVACIQCRVGKAKCDGLRPQCYRCKDSSLTCQYDVPPGVSRAERMKLLKKDTFSGKVEEMERIINILRSGTDTQASTILARLRLGERVEDVANSLPTTASTLVRTASFAAQESSGTAQSSLSHDPSKITTDTTTSLRHGSVTSLISSTGPIANLAIQIPSSSSSANPTLKGKQPTATDHTIKSPFLRPLFDREDFFLPISLEEDEDDDYLEMPLDPDLFDNDINIKAMGTSSIASPMDISRSHSQMPSPLRETGGRSIHVTHLVDRQPIVNTIRVHPNLNIRDLFGYTRTGQSLWGSQDVHLDNVHVPVWAMMTVATRSDPGSIKYVFMKVFEEASALIQGGTPASMVIERHPNIAALYDENEYNRSGILSQWAVGMVHSMRLEGYDFTCFASMYLFWCLMRWMISPSPETYETIPEWYRPTPNQLFMPHTNILDFVVWPAFRELAVQIPAMQERMEWMMDMSLNLRCDWSFSTEEALQQVEDTGLWDLCELAKTTFRDLSNWSLGPSFRGLVSNADSYVRIRTEQY